MSVNNITVVPVKTRKELRSFARFNVQLYKGNPYSVPDLIVDTKNSFTPSRNAAFEFCEAQPFIALIDGKVVGRVAAIINHNNLVTESMFLHNTVNPLRQMRQRFVLVV